MQRLPAHHVPRLRLTERCSGYSVVVVEAAGGYGKSVLGSELVDDCQSVGIIVELEHGGVPATLFSARLRDAAARAGYTDAAAVASGSQDPASALDALVAGLAGERCTFVIDDAHHAASDAGRLIHRLATRLEGDQRLVVLARQLPEGATQLRRAEYLQLTAADLALEPSETLQMCRAGFGLDVSAEEAQALTQATGGWTAAAVLAAARATRRGSGVEVAAPAADRAGGALSAILEEALVSLGAEARPLLAQVGRLPLVDAALVGTVTGDAGLFERGLEAGIPFTPAWDQWWILPGPVRDHLAAMAPADRDAIRRAAGEYGRRGELGAGLDLLQSLGDSAGAAAMMAAIPPSAEELVDTLELRAHFDQLEPAAVDANPAVLVLLARRLGHAHLYEECCQLLDRACELAARSGDKELDRAAAAELVKVRLLANMRYPGAVEEARRVLDATGSGERLTRARASEFLAYALCHLADDAGRRSPADLVEAERALALASTLYRALGMRAAASFVAVDWAVHIEFPQGRVVAALARVEEALEMIADRPRARGFVMIWRALFATELGQEELCRASVAEVLRVGKWIKSGFLAVHGHWKLAILASYQGDADTTLVELRQVEQTPKAWWALGGAEFLADAADLLDRVGQHTLALEYLARARADPQDAGHLIALAGAVIEARHGDPARAERELVALSQGRLDEREQWRVTLLRGFAAFRRGANDEAAALAARAMEEAARLGMDQAPLVRERVVAEQLLALAARTGQPAAVALDAASLPTTLAVLGRFELTAGGRSVELPRGQEARLLKFVTAAGGQVHVEEAIEALWPETDADAGRHRLRTVLHRLRAAAGPVLERSGELLVIGAGVGVDLYLFEAEATRALAMPAADRALAVAGARGAMSRYRGDLLPEDRFEEWAERARSRARRLMLDLLELCAREASERGDLDELRRVVEQSIEFSPYDDALYTRAVAALVEQGRRGEAISVIHRARAALGEIGLEPPEALLALEQTARSGRAAR